MNLQTAERLVALRKQRGISQEELAEKLNLSRQAVSKWERAEASPDTDNLIALADFYGVTLDQLIRGGDALDEEAEDAAAVDPDPIDPDNPLPNGSFFDYLAKKRHDKFPYPVLVSFLYLVLGFAFGLWHPGWIIFLTIPLFYLSDSQRSPLKLLGNPVMITIIYLLLGSCCGLWHPGWLVFFAVPILNAVTR